MQEVCFPETPLARCHQITEDYSYQYDNIDNDDDNDDNDTAPCVVLCDAFITNSLFH
jgi:hypothetical protein